MAFGSIGAGGGGFSLFTRSDNGQPAIFVGATRAAAETARDAYFTANPADLAVLDANQFLLIQLVDQSTDPDTVIYQNRQNSTWVDVNGIIQGPASPTSALFFPSIASRDAFFGVTENLALLETGLPIIVQIGDDTISSFVWTGGTSPGVYDPTLWRGASVTSPPGSFILGIDGAVISSANRGISFVSPGGQNQLITGVIYDDTGSETAQVKSVSQLINQSIATIDANTLADPFDLQADDFGLNSAVVRSLVVKPATSGTLTVVAYEGSVVGGPIILNFEIDIAPGDIGNETPIPFPNRIILQNPEQVLFRFSGIQLLGGVQTSGPFIGVNAPFLDINYQALISATAVVQGTDVFNMTAIPGNPSTFNLQDFLENNYYTLSHDVDTGTVSTSIFGTTDYAFIQETGELTFTKNSLTSNIDYLTATPEGSLARDPGSFAVVIDSGTADVLLKQSGTGNTGWQSLLGGTGGGNVNASATLTSTAIVVGEGSFNVGTIDNATVTDDGTNVSVTLQAPNGLGTNAIIWNDDNTDELARIEYNVVDDRFNIETTAGELLIRQFSNGGTFALRTQTEPFSFIFDGLSISPFLNLVGTASSDEINIYLTDQDPEGLIPADQGDVAYRSTRADNTSGWYLKETGIGNTGWARFLTTSDGGSGNVNAAATLTDGAVVIGQGSTDVATVDNFTVDDDGLSIQIFADVPAFSGIANITVRDETSVERAGVLYNDNIGQSSLFTDNVNIASQTSLNVIEVSANDLSIDVATGNTRFINNQASALDVSIVNPDGTAETSLAIQTAAQANRISFVYDPTANQSRVDLFSDGATGDTEFNIFASDTTTNRFKAQYVETIDTTTVDIGGVGAISFVANDVNNTYTANIGSALSFTTLTTSASVTSVNDLFIRRVGADTNPIVILEANGTGNRGISLFAGDSPPEGRVGGDRGDWFFLGSDTDDISTAYIKRSGADGTNTGWIDILSASGGGNVNASATLTNNAIVIGQGSTDVATADTVTITESGNDVLMTLEAGANGLSTLHLNADGTNYVSFSFNDTTAVANATINDLQLISSTSNDTIDASQSLDIISRVGNIDLTTDPTGDDIQVTVQPQTGAGTSTSTLRIVDSGATNGISLYHDGVQDDNYIDGFGAGDLHIRQTNSTHALRIRTLGGDQLFINSASAALSALMTWTVEGTNGAEIPIFAFSSNPEGNLTAPVGSVNFSDGNSGTAGIFFKESGAGDTGWEQVLTTSSGAGNVTTSDTLTATALVLGNGGTDVVVEDNFVVTNDGTNLVATLNTLVSNGNTFIQINDEAASPVASIGYVDLTGNSVLDLGDFGISSNTTETSMTVASGPLNIDVASGNTQFINLQGNTVRVEIINPLDTSTVEFAIQNASAGDEIVISHDEINDLSEFVTDGPFRLTAGGTMQFENTDPTNDVSFNNRIFFTSDSNGNAIEVYALAGTSTAEYVLRNSVGDVEGHWQYNQGTGGLLLGSVNASEFDIVSTAGLYLNGATTLNMTSAGATVLQSTSASAGVNINATDNTQSVVIQQFATFSRPSGVNAQLIMQGQNTASQVVYRMHNSSGGTVSDWIFDEFAGTVDFRSTGGHTLAINSANELDFFSGNSIGDEAFNFNHGGNTVRHFIETDNPNGSLSGNPGNATWLIDGHNSSLLINVGTSDGNTAWANALGQLIHFGDDNINTTTTERYLTPWYDSGPATTSPQFIRVRKTGVIKNLTVVHDLPAGNGNPVVYSVQVNGTDTLLSVQLASTGSIANNTTNVIPVSYNDTISVSVQKPSDIVSSPVGVNAFFELV